MSALLESVKKYVYPSFHRPSLESKIPAVLYHAAAKTALFVIAGIGALFVWPVLAAPLFTIAGTILATRLAIKIGDALHLQAFEKVQIYLARFRDKHRYIQIAALIAILIIGSFCWPAACALSIPFGIYVGIVIGLDYYASAQEAGRRAGVAKKGPLENILLYEQ